MSLTVIFYKSPIFFAQLLGYNIFSSDSSSDFNDEKLTALRNEAMLRARKHSRHFRVSHAPSVKDFDFPVFVSNANLEIYKNLEAQARKAINSRKIFYLAGGFEAVREELILRGWIEKLDQTDIVTEKMISSSVGDYEKTREILSNLVRNSLVSLVWGPKYLLRDFIPKTFASAYRNRIQRTRATDYCLKEGLHNIAENIQWSTVEDFSELSYPRSYLLLNANQRELFSNEYYRTMMISFLFYLNNMEDLGSLFADEGSVDIFLIYKTIEIIDNMIKFKNHMCIDLNESSEPLNFTIASQIDLVMRERKKIKQPVNLILKKLKGKISVSVTQIYAYWPDSKYDSAYNLWILKPINKSRGYGVVLMNSIEKIFDHVNRHQENKYLVQKYIERPYLIHKTKFDIRQYFLTLVLKESVQIWIYKNCYLKFASQEFSLQNFHESIHLTNNSIQRFYQNGARSSSLPFENMWSLTEFLSFLKLNSNNENIWDEMIFPKIKKNLLAIVLASLEDTDLVENNFELNGADFLLAFDLNPLILEINANPDMTSTTSTTEKICPIVLKDVIRVVLDQQKGSNEVKSIGDFELLHSVPINCFQTQKVELGIDGKKVVPPIKVKRRFFKTFAARHDLYVQGKTLKFKAQKISIEKKIACQVNDFLNETSKSDENSRRVSFQINPLKLYRTPRKPRKNLQAITVQPSYSNDSSYIKKLPSILQSSTRKINVWDLVRCLSIN